MNVAPARAAACRPLDVPHLSSLTHVELHRLRTPRTAVINLDVQQSEAVLHGLLRSADEAVMRLADGSRRALGKSPDPVKALIHLLTRSRFFKGSRSQLPLERTAATIRRYTDREAPVPLLLRAFPYKQHDNRLKAHGPLPDLAEAAALVRLRELTSAFRKLYPPGLSLTVLNDGGYYRPRPQQELDLYGAEIRRLSKLIGVADEIDFVAQSKALRALVDPRTWEKRAELTRQLRVEIELAIAPASRKYDADRAQRLLTLAGLATPANAVPPFNGLFRSLMYSVPVSGGPDPDWTARVLGSARDWQVPGMLGEARQQVLRQAWREAIDYTAATTADERLGLFRLLPHVRLSATPRPGVFGYNHVGGSVLPWHGTGSIDHRHRVGVDFSVSLRHKGFVAVHSGLFAPGQPWFLAAPELVEGNRLSPSLPGLVRLKSR